MVDTFYSYLRHSALSTFSLFKEQAQALSAYCHFHSFLIFHKHHIAQENKAKECIGITEYSIYHKIWSQVQTITRTILLQNQSPSVSNSQWGWSCEQIFDSSTTFLNPLVRMYSLYGKRIVSFFHSPHMALRASLVRSLMHVRLLSYAKPILGKKKGRFCSLLKIILKFLVSDAPIIFV